MTEVTHQTKRRCPQETRISLMEQGIDQMKSDIKEIKDVITKVDAKIDTIVTVAEAKYATKTELSFLKEQVLENKSGLSRLIDVLLRWGPLIAVAVYLVMGKTI